MFKSLLMKRRNWKLRWCSFKWMQLPKDFGRKCDVKGVFELVVKRQTVSLGSEKCLKILKKQGVGLFYIDIL